MNPARVMVYAGMFLLGVSWGYVRSDNLDEAVTEAAIAAFLFCLAFLIDRRHGAET